MSAGNSSPIFHVNGIAVRDVCRGVKQGSRIHFLEVIGKPFRTRPQSGPQWFCVVECECGSTRVVSISNLRSTKSCGCKTSEIISSGKTKHGKSRDPLYRVWSGMNGRCNDRRNQFYGGRGISVCDEWKEFETFYDWAIANGWKQGLQVDRYPDRDGDYCPSNCRLVTSLVNNNNSRRNVVLECFGERKTISEWSRDPRCAVDHGTLHSRLWRSGWDPEKAITTPKMTLQEASALGKISYRQNRLTK